MAEVMVSDLGADVNAIGDNLLDTLLSGSPVSTGTHTCFIPYKARELMLEQKIQRTVERCSISSTDSEPGIASPAFYKSGLIG